MTYENITERQVLCFGDSNTYGYDPVRDGRYGPDERYPMVLQSLLGPGWAVAEEGLPGRTAVFDDPITEGMNGLRLINPILMSHAPLDTVTIMLGTNDCKARFACDSYQIAQRLAPMLQGLPGVRFLDANTLPGAVCSPVDGMHMTKEAHRALAQGLYDLLTGSAPAAH